MPRPEQKRDTESVPWIPALVIVLIIIAGLYFWLYGDDSLDTTTPPVAEKPLPDDLKVPEKEPAVEYPVPEPEPQQPAAEDSASEAESTVQTPPQEEAVETAEPEPPVEPPTLQETLGDFLGNAFTELFIPEALVRHFVVTVDNMTTEKLPQRFRFARPPEGKFAVIKRPNGDIFLDPDNYERYTPYVILAENTDLKRLVDIYVRYYHLFQEAYENLGYPQRYFNDRLVEVIDHLLATPETSGKIALAQPKVFYRYTNPKLQALSAGQKLLVRMGPDNANRVKARLRNLRELLTGLGNA